MYSDMSSRTIAVSSLNRYSASAFVSSVLPTPVGPKNMNEPIGRFGSCRPARERRTAVATARTASAWPTTRLPSWPSIFRSLSFSPSSILSTGTPVQRDTTCAICFFHLRFLLHLQPDDFPVDRIEFFRLGIVLHLQPRRGLIEQVDRLVGQETVGDVAVRQRGRGHQRGIGDANAVMLFVLVLQ